MKKFIYEAFYDYNLFNPAITATDREVLAENVDSVVMISEESITLKTKQNFVGITGVNFEIKEIEDGKVLIQGEIQKIEFFSSLNKVKD